MHKSVSNIIIKIFDIQLKVTFETQTSFKQFKNILIPSKKDF